MLNVMRPCQKLLAAATAAIVFGTLYARWAMKGAGGNGNGTNGGARRI